MRVVWSIFLWSLANSGYTFSWHELWVTKDQQAQALMQQKKFDKAEKTFQQEEWRATAAYRAGHYEQAAKEFQSIQNEQGYYNQGNALAHLGRYEEAIKAYDKALALNAHNQDAIYNRNLLQELLKKRSSNKAKTSRAKTSRAKTSKAKTSRAKTSRAKTSRIKTSRAKTSRAKTSKAKTSKAKTSRIKTSRAKTSKAKTSRARIRKAKRSRMKRRRIKQPQ